MAEPEPAQRNDYTPVVNKRWKAGARKRSYLSSGGDNLASSSTRNIFKGWSGEMRPLANGVVGESFEQDENKIFQIEHDIKRLIEQLETKDENKAQ